MSRRSGTRDKTRRELRGTYGSDELYCDTCQMLLPEKPKSRLRRPSSTGPRIVATFWCDRGHKNTRSWRDV